MDLVSIPVIISLASVGAIVSTKDTFYTPVVDMDLTAGEKKGVFSKKPYVPPPNIGTGKTRKNLSKYSGQLM